MKKSLIVILALVACLALTLAGVAYAAKVKTKSGEVDEVVTVDNTKAFGTLTKSSVKFNHSKHFGELKVKCDQCHHVFKDKKQVWKEGDKVERCAACHKTPKENEGEMLSLMNAYHKNCRDCHKNEKKGPTKCDECHPKK